MYKYIFPLTQLTSFEVNKEKHVKKTCKSQERVLHFFVTLYTFFSYQYKKH